MQITVSQIAAHIIAQVTSLESTRRKLFLVWLCAHSNQAITGSDLNYIQNSLADWFEPLSEADVLREYDLVTTEVRWWRNLKEQALEMMLDELEGGGTSLSYTINSGLLEGGDHLCRTNP